MKPIKLEVVLSYCDGINLFLGKDGVGHLYMVSALESDENIDTFFAVECTKDQYVQYQNFRIDLYDIIMKRSGLCWYKVDVPNFDYSCELILQEQTGPLPDEYLPQRSDLAGLRKEMDEAEMKNDALFFPAPSMDEGFSNFSGFSVLFDDFQVDGVPCDWESTEYTRKSTHTGCDLSKGMSDDEDTSGRFAA